MQAPVTFPLPRSARTFGVCMAVLFAFAQLPLAIRNELFAFAALHVVLALVFGFVAWRAGHAPAASLSEAELVIHSPFGFAFARIALPDVEHWTFDPAAREFRFTLRDGSQKRAGQGWVAEPDLEALLERLEALVPGRVTH